MSAVAFDTLKYAKRLKEAGFTEQQAEALASAQVDLIEARLATKADIFGLTRDIKEVEAKLTRDIKEVEAKLTRDIEALRADVQRDLKDLEYRLTIRLGGMMALAIGVVATLVKVL
jgi:predicted phage-related endonuclease